MQVLQEAYEVSSGIDPRPALALGGGIGHAGDVCGGVNGGAIAIGLLCSERIADPAEAKLRARQLALAFHRDFVAEFGHADCASLIGMDTSTEEGLRAFFESDLKKARCSRYVTYAVRRLLPLRDEIVAGG